MAIINVTPIMTSDTTPAPYIATANSIIPSYPASCAFNNQKSDYWHSADYEVAGCFLQMDFSEKTYVSSVELTAPIDWMVCTPASFDILGSNDGTNYDTLISITGQVNWTSNEVRNFDFDEMAYYRYYKLLVHTSSYRSIRIGELKYFFDTAKLNKYIILDSGTYKTMDNNGLLQPLSITNLTQDSFDTNGFSNISDLYNNLSSLNKSFKLFSENNFALDVYGLKSVRELFVASDNIHMEIAQNIDYFKLFSSNIKNGFIKLTLSIDKGLTWMTWNRLLSCYEKLNCTIPIMQYESLSQEELSQWNYAKNTIADNGITVDDFNHLDFNNLTAENKLPQTIRFAYVIDRPAYEDNVSMTNLSWNFDAKGSFKKMKNSEYDADVYEHHIKFTSLIENPLIKVNILV